VRREAEVLRPDYLVPKLYLGTPVPELNFAPLNRGRMQPRNRASHPWVRKQSLGKRGRVRAAPPPARNPTWVGVLPVAILAMAILAVAILAVAILAVVILAVAVLAVAILARHHLEAHPCRPTALLPIG